ncbi:UTRA domain-containing protein [Variovorax sp. CF079]|nr:UTRA domain-containing protein [Variovorax sp. CF079]
MTKSPKTPVYSLIERSYGVRITKVQQDIHGTLIAGASAAALNVSDGAAGLFIIRRLQKKPVSCVKPHRCRRCFRRMSALTSSPRFEASKS